MEAGTPVSQPAAIRGWFRARGWRPYAHQLAMWRAAEAGRSALLVAPTGGGKTLAGFLPSIADLATLPRPGLHTLYISPLKALAVDIHRNLEAPIAEMGLDIGVETRTGDTPQRKRERQRRQPPQMLMTTPESLALMLSWPDAPALFASLRCVIVDELHALADNKRGDLLSLGLARLGGMAPGARRTALSATVADRDYLAAWLSPSAGREPDVETVVGRGGVAPEIAIARMQGPMPWSGHMAVYALGEIHDAIRAHRTTIVFVNTRAQAELIFRGLWDLNEDGLAIALHHGSLAPEQRRKVEAAMAAGRLRAVVATSSLDLGIDWGDVDLVVQVGAPKGAARLLQRLGRSNHRLDRPSKALLVPANRFEVLECHAAIDAIRAGTLDGDGPEPGGLDVLAQHIAGVAASGPFEEDALFREVRRAHPYRGLTARTFSEAVDFVATGGYALGAYERYRRLKRDASGRLRAANGDVVRRYRMNVGTIVEAVTLKVRLGGRVLGEVEEYFANTLTPGDTFAFAGRVLRFEGIREMTVRTSSAAGEAPRIPAYGGGRLPLTTHLADRVRGLLADRRRWREFPPDVLEWLRVQDWRSVLPRPGGLLVETFPRGGKWYLVAYCFEGRNAHQTLGMLLTRRMERAGLGPLGFCASDYVLAVWSLREAEDVDELLSQDMLGDDLEDWMAESTLLRRTFRNVAVVSGLIERRHPGREKTRRQVTFNADLIYDVLRRHEPNHLLLRATRRDAARGLTDIRRLGEMLARARGRIELRRLDRVSPLAVPVLLEIGKEFVYGGAIEEVLAEAAAESESELVAEAMAGAETAELPL